MKTLIVPLLLLIIGVAAGGGAGFMMYTPPDPEMEKEMAEEKEEEKEPEPVADFVKLNNQFVVPVVRDGQVSALVVMSLALQVDEGTTDSVYESEPKIRDVFLQVLFDHANVGGFDGQFTDGSQLSVLRRSLTEAARTVLDKTVQEVLISNIDRQDVG